MEIVNLRLKNFRCYTEESVTFKGGINFLVGPNAVGKTSIAEAIYILGLSKSPRGSDEKSLINSQSENFFVEGDLLSSTMNKYKVSLGFDGTKKVFKKNQTVIKKLSDYIGVVDVVWFSASDLYLLAGSPQNRRVNFDRIMCQISKVYFGALSNYKKFLKERNALLKRLIFENNKQLEVLIDTINEKLVFEGNKIINMRKKIINKVNGILSEYSNNPKEQLCIKYIANVGEEDFNSLLNKNLNEDIKRGNTGFGPHKDDYIFIINNKNIVDEGSQGQQRNAILNLKFAEVKLINEVKNENPILILDDLFSELDKNRKNEVLKALPNGVQTIITTTTLVEIDDEILKNVNIISLKGDN